MAGRPKAGLDYAGWSVNIFDGDTKIDKLLDAQGWSGFGIYFYLCQMAYKFDGYFYRWSYDDSATTARRMGGGIGSETVRQTVGLCLQIGLFDRRLFDRDGILTSRGIQRRFSAAIQGRRVKAVIARYWLLGSDESKGLEQCAAGPDLPASEGRSQGADGHLPGADGPKRKEEKREEQERRADSPQAGSPPVGPGSAVSFFLERINPAAARTTLDLLADFERDLGPEVCVRAMLEARAKGKADWRYIHGILKNKRRDGIRSLAAWDAAEAALWKKKEVRHGAQGESPRHGAGEWL